MAGKLPTNFDPQRYLESYPDVGLSGLSPKEHFLRFGKLIGRNPAGTATLPKEPAAKRKASAPAVEHAAAEGALMTAAAPKPRAAIIERPVGFEAAKSVPLPAGPKAGCGVDGTIGIKALAAGPYRSSEEDKRIRLPLLAYAQMVSAKSGPASAEIRLSGTGRFQSGPTRLENAWFADRSTLRFVIAGGKEEQSETAGWAVRAYQADATAPAQLRMAGGGLQMPASGPVFLDVGMDNPLMPLVLELSDPDGKVRDIALLPFPSLLPGGHHSGELKALQSEANPIDAFWTISEGLLCDLLGGPGSPGRSITQLSMHGRSAAAEISPEMEQWLGAVFGLSISDRPKKDSPEELRLLLPSNAVPAIGALVSRRLLVGAGEARAGPFLVSEPVTFRPRWSVSLPADVKLEPSLPVLLRGGRKSSRKSDSAAIATHLAIALREPGGPAVTTVSDKSSTVESQPKLSPLTVVIDTTDATRVERLLRVLSTIAGKPKLEFLIRLPDDGGAVAEVLDRIRGPGKWTNAGETDLRELARHARHETLLTISDQVTLADAEVLRRLCELLHSNDRVASASCMLFAETIVKKRAVIQPATGGLFPAGVSFATSPRLAFWEPDVRHALPDLVYPVVANTLLLTVWRSGVLAALDVPQFPTSKAGADIRLGLDLIEIGLQNLCSSRLSAMLQGPYVRRDTIDPMGAAYSDPQRWEEVLARVSVVRELH